MESLIKELNDSHIFSETIKIDKLEIDKAYKIIEAKTVKTKFGNSIVIEIIHNKEIKQLFLPSRFSKIFNKETIKDLTKLRIIYKGENKDYEEGSYKIKHMIEFVKKKIESESDKKSSK